MRNVNRKIANWLRHCPMPPARLQMKDDPTPQGFNYHRLSFYSFTCFFFTFSEEFLIINSEKLRRENELRDGEQFCSKVREKAISNLPQFVLSSIVHLSIGMETF